MCHSSILCVCIYIYIYICSIEMNIILDFLLSKSNHTVIYLALYDYLMVLTLKMFKANFVAVQS